MKFYDPDDSLSWLAKNPKGKTAIGISGNGSVEVVLTYMGFYDIKVSDALLNPKSKQELQDLLVSACNDAMDKLADMAKNGGSEN